jgi:RHS repeat-associated protein
VIPFNGPEESTLAIDVNSDGRVDLIRYLPWAHEAWLNTGAGWALDSAYSNFNFSQDPWQNDQGARLVDVNGDDLPDWIRQNAGATTLQLNTDAGWGPMQSNPLLFNVPYEVGTTAFGVMFTDYNADGLTDILTGRAFETNYAFINTGTGWIPDSGYQSPTDFIDSGNGDEGMRMVDLNNNGLPDLARRGQFSGYGWLNTGTNWTGVFTNTWNPGNNCQYVDNALRDAVRFADFNGDGLVDVFCTNGTSTIPSTTTEINTGTQNDLLMSVDLPTGGASQFTYQATPLYLDSTGARLNPSLPYVILAVETITNNDGLGTISTQTYSYEGGSYYYASAQERKFAGFHSITVTDTAGFATTTWYHQGDGTDTALGEASDHFAKIGKPFRVEVNDATGNLVRVIVNTWDRSDLVACVSFVKLSATVSLDYDGDTDHRDKAVSYTYDNSSTNILQQIEWGEVNASTNGAFVDVGSDRRTTDLQYTYNSTYRMLGLPSQETTLDQSGVRIAQTISYYDNQGFGNVINGNLTREERWKSGASYVDVERAYNAFGFMTQELDPLNHITTYTPDAYNLYPSSVMNALGQSTSYLYDYSSGKPTQITDVNGRVFQTTYDGFDRVLEDRQPNAVLPSTLEVKTSYVYSTETIGMRTQRTDYFDSTIAEDSYVYTDGFDRPIQTRVESETSGVLAVSDTIYDTREFLWKQSLSYFSTGVARTPVTSMPAFLSTFSNDALGRITNIATAVGNTSTTYDQWNSTVTDPRGKVKTFSRDAYDRLVTVIENNSSAVYTTVYTYNGRGDLTGLTDALGNTRSFTYDGLSRRLTAQDLHASGDTTFGIWTYVYDDAGNFSSTLDPKGQTIQFTYDNINRQLTENYTGVSGVEVTNTYDTCTNGVGRLCTVAKTGFSESRAYDPLGRVSLQTRTIEGTPYTTSFAYDRQGNQLTITNPDSSQVQYVYNNAGQLNQVNRKENAGGYVAVVSNIDYAPTERRTVIVNANGTTTTNTYDAGELYRLRTKITSTPSGNQQNLTYTYDPNGNVTQIVDASSTQSAKTTIYAYDDLNRLLSATVTGAADGQNGTQSSTYNAIGNILTRSDVTGTYAYAGNTASNYANPHATTAAGGVNYTYDQNGNLATSSITTTTTTTPTPTPAWYPSTTGSWSHRLPLTIQQSYINGTAALTNFPVLVSRTITSLRTTTNGGNVAQTNGYDLLFTASDGVTKLDHEIEKYDPVTGQLVAWVRIPSLSATVNTSVYLYVGNPSSVNQQNSTAVWESSYKGVWHLDENPTTVGAPITDSTSNAYNGTPYGSMPASASSVAKIGQGLSFDGSNDYVDLGFAQNINSLTNNFTVSAWVRSTNLSGTRRFISAGRATSSNGFGFGTYGTYPRFSTYGKKNYTRSTVLAVNIWAKLDAVMQNNNVLFYRNGVYLGSVSYSSGGIANTDDTLRLGASTLTGFPTVAELFVGSLDEVRVSQSVRPQTWIQAEYNNQNAPTSFVTTGTIQAYPTPVTVPVTVTTTYAWDYNNRLTSISSPALSASFLYDHDGTRVKSLLGGITTKTPTTWYNDVGTIPTKHILLPDGEMLATVEGSNTSATVSYIHTDYLTGSAVVTNTSGSQIQLLDYHPFGTIRINNQSTTFNEKRKFAGHEYDTETGLSYMQARYYHPATGRFISEDPAFLDIGIPAFSDKYQRSLEQHLQNPQSLNSYAYGLNNPVTFRDPQGEIVPLIVLGAWAAVEFGLSAYDAYSTYQTLASSEAGGLEKAVTLGGFAAGLALPGGGYGTVGKQVVKHGNGVVDAVKAGGKASEQLQNGWKVGDPFTNNTAKGNVPSWSAVRQRYWKNEALKGKENLQNLERMQRGLAPKKLDSGTGKWSSVELHHDPPQRKGGLFQFRKVTPSQHAKVDSFRRNKK